jgi:hypothetical protein
MMLHTQYLYMSANIIRLPLLCVYVLIVIVCINTKCQAKVDQLTPQPSNAALKYLRAYASLHLAEDMPTNISSLLNQYETLPLTEQVSKIVASAEDALREMHYGASIQHCDWSISKQDGIKADTSHRGVARELIAIAGLRARVLFNKNQSMDAANSIMDAITVARHLSTDGSIASVLIANTLEKGSANLLAKHLLLLEGKEIEQIKLRYKSLPDGASMSEALLSHEELTREMLNQALSSAKEQEDVINWLSTLPVFENGGAVEFLEQCGGKREDIIEKIEALRPLYKKWTGWFSLSPEEFERRYKADSKELGKNNPVFRLLTPSIDNLRWAEAISQTRRALLLASLEIQQKGKQALDQYLDPYDGKLFTYIITDKGFRLESSLKEDGKQLTIRIGSIN